MKDIRCQRNQYHTLLFRVDHRGMFIYCKDCYSHSENKKGTQHLFTWGQILGLLMRFVFGLEGELPDGISYGRDEDN